MTDRTRCLTVVLDKEYRTDDAASITAAIAMVKGVASVDMNISDWNTHTAISTAKIELREKLWEVLK